MSLTATATGLFTIGSKLIDKFIPDPEQRDKAKLELIEAESRGEMDVIKSRLGAIMTEAQSEDAYVSRARPTFLYIFYAILVNMVIVTPVLSIFFPQAIAAYYTAIESGFKSIPSELWGVFTVGYLGYVGSREYGKRKKIEAMTKMAGSSESKPSIF